jgi:hypothetical protein
MNEVIKNEILKINNLGDLNEVVQFISQYKDTLALSNITVGQNVYVVQKTKRTPGVVKKINRTRALVDMKGNTYRVPFSMIEPRHSSGQSI